MTNMFSCWAKILAREPCLAQTTHGLCLGTAQDGLANNNIFSSYTKYKFENSNFRFEIFLRPFFFNLRFDIYFLKLFLEAFLNLMTTQLFVRPFE